VTGTDAPRGGGGCRAAPEPPKAKLKKNRFFCIHDDIEDFRERDHWGDLGVDGWIILGWISRRWDVGMWTGLGWPRVGIGGGRL